MRPTSKPRREAAEARSKSRGFAESALTETDDGMKAYLRHLAVSWNEIAEQHEFLAEIEERRQAGV